MNMIMFDFMSENSNNIIIGMHGEGKSVTDMLVKHKLLNNNYRKMHHLPLVRKGHSCYNF